MFPPNTRLHARGLLLAARLELRQWPEAETLHRAPPAVALPGGGLAVLFRHGVAVLFALHRRPRRRCWNGFVR